MKELANLFLESPAYLITVEKRFYFDLMQNITFQFVGQFRAEWIILADDQEC